MTYIHGLDNGFIKIDPADPVDGVDMVSIEASVELVSVRLVVPAGYVLEAVARAAGLGAVGPFVDLIGLAERCGLAFNTARKYRTDGKLPAPSARFGKSDVWDVAVVDVWNANRGRRDSNVSHNVDC